MTAVDRLAAIIEKALIEYAGEFYPIESWDRDCAAAYVAAVIASSDDLTVISLPKSNEREDGDVAVTWGEAYSNLQVGVHDEYADQVQVWVDYEPIEPWSPREAEEFASHLLAAASSAKAYQAAHGMLPGSHERRNGPECRCGNPWDRWNDRCSSVAKAAEELNRG